MIEWIECSVKVSNTYMKLDHDAVQSVFEVAVCGCNHIRGTIRSENIKPITKNFSTRVTKERKAANCLL